MLFCLFQSGISLLIVFEDGRASLILRARVCCRLRVGCINSNSAYEDEGQFCNSPARAARCSLPSAIDYGSLIIVGLGTLVVLLVGPQLIAYRGFLLDYQWRPRLIVRPLLSCLAQLESCARSSQPVVAQKSTNSCSGPAGRVFPAAYRATDVRSPGCGRRRVCQQSETLESVCGVIGFLGRLWWVFSLFFLWASSGSSSLR